MTDPSNPIDAPRTAPRCPLCSDNSLPVLASHVLSVLSAEAVLTRWLLGAACDNTAVIACHHVSLQQPSLKCAVLTSSCASVARLRIVLRSQMCACPSVPALTTAAPPGSSTKPIASTLSSSVCPASAPMTSPLLRLTMRMPPDSPPTTANVDEGLTPKEVIPPKSKRVLLGPSLKTGVGDLGSQNMRNPSAHAVIIRLPETMPEQRIQLTQGSQPTIWSKFTTLDSPSVAGKYLHGGSRWHCDPMSD